MCGAGRYCVRHYSRFERPIYVMAPPTNAVRLRRRNNTPLNIGAYPLHLS